MIVEKKFLNKLKQFGLNSYEAKIWTALLSRGISTAGELSDISNVPRSRSYDVLESLERKGFIIMKIGKPIKYIAVKPSEVLERVKNRIMDDADQQTAIVEELKDSDVLNELNLLHNKGIDMIDPTNLTAALKDRTQIYNQLSLMLKSANKEVSIMTTPMGLVRKVDALRKTFAKANARGVKFKIITNYSKEVEKYLKQVLSFAEIRFTDSIRSRFFIVDNKEVVFTLTDDKGIQPTYDSGVWVSTPYFSNAMTNMFNAVWEKASESKIKIKQ